MGKVKPSFKSDPNNVSRHAKKNGGSASVSIEPSNAKERIEQELQLLHARKQAIDVAALGPTPTATVHKVGKKKSVVMKKSANARQQKKLAKALLVAEKSEARVEKLQVKAEKRKARKAVWT